MGIFWMFLIGTNDPFDCFLRFELLGGFLGSMAFYFSLFLFWKLDLVGRIRSL